MNKLQLKNITLLSYNCVNPIQSVKALMYSCKEIEFAEVILVAPEKPEKTPSNIKFVETKNRTHAESSNFTFVDLPKLITTDYCLNIHDDGFVINPHLWTNDFLNYDYIGAPWKNYGQRNRVGNGGFVLRSNKFIQLTKYLHHRPNRHDDGELCIDYYDYFISKGCKYAPLELAAKFSLESKIPECEYNLDNCFGFHGRGLPETISVHDGEYQQFADKQKLLETVGI
jgi:hypothetical protein